MKYWLLTTEYPPFYGGGISTYCQYTAEMLSTRGIEVSVFIPDPSIKNIKTQTNGQVRVIRFNPNRTRSSSFLGHVTNLSYEFAAIIKEFLEKEGPPDLIEAQEYLGIAYYILQFKLLKYKLWEDIPVIITAHSPSFLYLEYNDVETYKYPHYWIGEMERSCLQAADHVIFPSRYLLNEIRERFALGHERISILANPFIVKRSSQSISTEQQQIAFYGKLSAQKGTFKLLEYFDQLWKDGFKEKLYLIGGNDIVYQPEGKTMYDLVRKRYKNYIVAGLLVMEDKIQHADIEKRLAPVKLVIIPSIVDNLPYVVFEMMSLGKIVLVSRQGGQSEIVQDGENGFIFDHKDPLSFTTKLRQVLAMTATQRELIGRNAADTIVSRYNIDTIYEKKIEIIRSVERLQYKSSNFPFTRSLTPTVAVTIEKDDTLGLLSIVIPFYNMAPYLKDAVDSIKMTTHPAYEIIIINDGSTDANSLSVLDQYRKETNVVVYDIANKGLAHARNYGAKKANGQFLAFLDADDKIDSGYYSKAIKALSYANIHFVGCWTRYFGDSGRTWPTFNPEPPLILFHNLVNSSSLVYKKQIFLCAGINDEAMRFKGLEDYSSVVSLLANGFRGVVLPEVLFHYRVRPDSMIRGMNGAKKAIICGDIASGSQAFYSKFATDLFNLLTVNGPGIYLDNPSLDLHLADKMPFGGKLSLRLISLIKRNRFIKMIAYKVYRSINK